jgi:hypothetical protein
MTLPSHARITAAVIAPLAVLAVGCSAEADDATDTTSATPSESSASSDPTDSTTEPAGDAGIDYVADGSWHQADGDVVRLPDRDYDSAVIWNDQLVATYFDGEVFLVADVIDADGKVVDSFPTTAPVAVNEAGTTIAWVGDGRVMTAWESDSVSLGTVDLSAPGEAVAWSAVAITGGPNCYEEVDGCQVFVNSGLGEESRSFSSHGINDIVARGVTKVFDATDDGVVSVINKVTDDLDTCGGLLDQIDITLRWTTCDYQVQQISPDGAHVAAPQSQYDGLGPTQLSILDTTTGDETGRYAPEGGFIAEWAWSTYSSLVFTAYDGANWHLMTMNPDGEIAEIGDPVSGDDFDSPFTLIRH